MSPPKKRRGPAANRATRKTSRHHAARQRKDTPGLSQLGAAFEALGRDDVRWFNSHPGETVRYRPAGEHEWPPSLLNRPVTPPGLVACPCVEVEQLAPGVRVRRP